MISAPSCVLKLYNAAVHACTDAVHGVCRVFGLVCLQQALLLGRGRQKKRSKEDSHPTESVWSQARGHG